MDLSNPLGFGSLKHSLAFLRLGGCFLLLFQKQFNPSPNCFTLRKPVFYAVLCQLFFGFRI